NAEDARGGRRSERVERDRRPGGDAGTVLERSPPVRVGFGARVDLPAGARHDGARAEPHPVVRARLRLSTEGDAARDGELARLVQRHDDDPRGAVGLLSPRVAEVKRKADRAENADHGDQHDQLDDSEPGRSWPETTPEELSVLAHIRLA